VLDDLIITGKKVDDYMKNIRLVFRRIGEHYLRLYKEEIFVKSHMNMLVILFHLKDCTFLQKC